jgi:hypothetical protein
MRALIIDDEARVEINKVNFPTMEKMMSGEVDPVGCRHLSVSVGARHKLPNIPAVELIMKEFGFSGDIHDCLNVWIEDERAINVIQEQ